MSFLGNEAIDYEAVADPKYKRDWGKKITSIKRTMEKKIRLREALEVCLQEDLIPWHISKKRITVFGLLGLLHTDILQSQYECDRILELVEKKKINEAK